MTDIFNYWQNLVNGLGLWISVKGFEREVPQDNTSKCIDPNASKCDSITCLVQHAKCKNLGEGEKGYDISGNKDMGVGYSCEEKCHEIWFYQFNFLCWWQNRFCHSPSVS